MATQGWLTETVMSYEHVLVALRHGQTAYNIEDRLTTTTDIPLSAEGVAQASRAGLALAGCVFDTAASSPLERARHTAELALAHTNISEPMRIDERLTEVAAGMFEGFTYSELRSGEIADLYTAYCSESNPSFPDGTETLDDSTARAQTVLADAQSQPGRHVVVSHGAFLRVLACVAAGQNPACYRRLQISNCGVLLVRFYPTPPAQLCGLNLPAGGLR